MTWNAPSWEGGAPIVQGTVYWTLGGANTNTPDPGGAQPRTSIAAGDVRLLDPERWSREVDAFVRRFAEERAPLWHLHPGDLEDQFAADFVGRAAR